MRILMLHNRYKIRGGEDEVALAESKMLRDYGHDVTLLELDNDSISGAGNVRTAIGAVWSRESYRIVRERLAREKPDVLHVQNFFPLFSPSVYYAAAACGTAVVQSVHNYRLVCPAATLSFASFRTHRSRSARGATSGVDLVRAARRSRAMRAAARRPGAFRNVERSRLCGRCPITSRTSMSLVVVR